MVLCDRCGSRMPAVRATMEAKIGRAYRGLDLTLDCFPEDDVPDDPNAAIRVGLHTSRHEGDTCCAWQSRDVPACFSAPSTSLKAVTQLQLAAASLYIHTFLRSCVTSCYFVLLALSLDLMLDCFPEDDVPDDPNAAIRVGLHVTHVMFCGYKHQFYLASANLAVCFCETMCLTIPMQQSGWVCRHECLRHTSVLWWPQRLQDASCCVCVFTAPM
jgi:hypothetical protein